MNIGIIYNCPEGSHGVSMGYIYQSVDDVALAIEELGYNKVLISVASGRRLPSFIKSIWHVDCILNLNKGIYEKEVSERRVAALLEMLNLPYTGSGPEALTFACYKVMIKDLFVSRKILTPSYRVIKSLPVEDIGLDFPLSINPTDCDASWMCPDENLVHTMDELQHRSEEFLKISPQLIVEECVHGRNLNVVIYDGAVLAIGEISPEEQQAVSIYRNVEHMCSTDFDTPFVTYTTSFDGMEDVVDVALKAFKATGMRDYGCVEIIVDENSCSLVTSINPSPDISRDSGFVKAIMASGVDYNSFIKSLITMAMKREEGYNAKTIYS